MSGLMKLALAGLKAAVLGNVDNEVLKTVIEEGVDGPVSEQLEKYLENARNEIGRILSDERLEEMNIPEERRKYVREEIKRMIGGDEIDGKIIERCEYDVNRLQSVLWESYQKTNTLIEYPNDLKKVLCAVIKKAVDLAMHSRDFVPENLLKIQKSVKNTNKLIAASNSETEQKLDKILEILSCDPEQDKQTGSVKSEDTVIFRNNKKKEYIEKWSSRLFLHTGKDDMPLTLENAFIMPDYRMIEEKPKYSLKILLRNFIEGTQRNLLLLGQPGMGKSSIISFLAHEYQDKENLIILKFKDLDEKRMHDKHGLYRTICEELQCEAADLRNKVLILDAFDEIHYEGNTQDLLEEFLIDIKWQQGLKVLITSRENYINLQETEFQSVVVLKPFGPDKMIPFYQKVCNVTDVPEIEKWKNKEIIGIPVILYMALTVGVDLSEGGSKSELYDKIFALKGGIFDRFATKYQHGYETDPHQIEYIKKEFKEILGRLAFEMFDSLLDFVQHDTYIKIAQSILEDSVPREIMDFPIKNLYASDQRIEFVHKSIYEYFIAEYIFMEMSKVIETNKKKNAARRFAELFENGVFSYEIKEALTYKFEKSFEEKEWEFVEDVFSFMIGKGMTSCLKNISTNVLNAETNIFRNMMDVIRFRELNPNKLIVLDDTIKWMLSRYIKSAGALKIFLDLSYMDLSGIELMGANLTESRLLGANLEDAELLGADLAGANLQDAKLDYADLGHVNLQRADLRGASLHKAELRKADLSWANLQDTVLTGAGLREARVYRIDVNGAVFDIDNVVCVGKENGTLKNAFVYLNGKKIPYDSWRS